MKKIKIIDILAGKEKPNKFKYNAGTFERQNNGGYIDEDGDNLTEWIFSDYSNIYDEVLIIEKIKKIEYIGKTYDLTSFYKDYSEPAILLRDMTIKMKEIIDKMNELEKRYEKQDK